MAKDPEGPKIDYVDLFDAEGLPTTDHSKAARGSAMVRDSQGRRTHVTLMGPRWADQGDEPETIKGEA